MYSFRVEQAIRAAAVLHRDQVRKGELPFPYVTHLVSVAFILSDYTEDEDVIVAALLHDTLEDTSYTETELQEDFGGRVKDIVCTLTEPKYKGETALSWAERKKAYLKQIKEGSEEAMLIAAADKAHNMRTVVEAYYDNHDRFTKDFGGTLADRIKFYQDLSNVINRNLKSEILHEFNHVFEEYKQFVYAVEKSKNEI